MGRREEEISGEGRNNNCLTYLELITDLLRVLNYFKLNISYEELTSCSLYELDYWVNKANELVREEEEKNQ